MLSADGPAARFFLRRRCCGVWDGVRGPGVLDLALDLPRPFERDRDRILTRLIIGTSSDIAIDNFRVSYRYTMWGLQFETQVVLVHMA